MTYKVIVLRKLFPLYRWIVNPTRRKNDPDSGQDIFFDIIRGLGSQ